jgi:hypothetical protein
VGSIEASRKRFKLQFINSGTGIEYFEGGKLLRIADAGNVSKNVRSVIQIRV